MPNNTFDLALIAYEAGINDILGQFQRKFEYRLPVDFQKGRLRITGDIYFRTPRGRIEFNPDQASGPNDYIRLKEMDLETEMDLRIIISIPAFKIGGTCVDIPCDGTVCSPSLTVWRAQNISFPVNPLNLPLPPQEFDATGWIEPILNPETNKWEFRLRFNPFSIDVDLIDWADWLGNLFDQTVRQLLENLAGGLLGAVLSVIGDFIAWLLREVLDFIDDLDVWFRNWLVDTLGIRDHIRRFVEEKITKPIVVFSLDREFEIDKEHHLILPIEHIDVDVETSSRELHATVRIEEPGS